MRIVTQAGRRRIVGKDTSLGPMLSELNRIERIWSVVITAIVMLAGLALASAGRDSLLGPHGLIIFLFGIVAFLVAMGSLAQPKPSDARLSEYYDTPTRYGILFSLIWAVFGFFIGTWVAWQLAYPELNFDQSWSNFGRLRPVHTTGVIFGFGGNALIATSYHVVQRTSRARLPDALSPWVVLAGYNLFCILAVTGYWIGITQSKEYAEPEWYADILLTVVWVIYFLLYLRTLARRAEPHIYVANWYYLAFILVVAMLHIVNSLAIPVSLGHAKSYSLFAGSTLR